MPTFVVDLTRGQLPAPRLHAKDRVVHVPAFTDLKLHDICAGPGDPNIESLDMQQPPGSPEFFAGNSKFLTRKLWGCANEPPYFHHGQYTTLRAAIEAHHGEAEVSRRRWAAAGKVEQDALIEFLKTLRVLPEGTRDLGVDERGRRKEWPPFPYQCAADAGAETFDDGVADATTPRPPAVAPTKTRRFPKY